MAQRREATFGTHRFHSISRLAAVTVLTACISAPPGVPAPEKVVPVIPAPHVARPGGTESWVAPDTLNVWIADTANAELKALGAWPPTSCQSRSGGTCRSRPGPVTGTAPSSFG